MDATVHEYPGLILTYIAIMKSGPNYPFILILILVSCSPRDTKPVPQATSIAPSKMTRELVDGMHWMNPPLSFGVKDSTLNIQVVKGTDFFNNPEDGSVVGSAPFLYQEVEGDFVVKVLVQPDFSAQWNAVALMAYIDSLNWIKFAFENSDATGPGVVTVVTKGTSDDANGIVMRREKAAWLALVRKDHIYAMHWSLDGQDFKMARLTSMPEHGAVKIGIEAQSPVGDSAMHQVHAFEIMPGTIDNLRSISQPSLSDQLTSKHEEEIFAIRNASNAALRAYDTERVLSFLTEDVLITTGNGTLLSGKKALSEYIESAGDSKMYWIRTPHQLSVNASRGLAWENGTWKGYDPTQETESIIGGNYSAMWTNESGRWLIKSQLFVTLE